MSTLDRIKSLGFSGRHGHPCLYDVISEAVKLAKPMSYLEIGVFDGASLSVVLNDAPDINRLVLCDIFNRDWQTWLGGPMGKYVNQPVGSHTHIDDLLKHHKFKGEATFLIEDSRTAIRKIPHDTQFDLIHIDGNHETIYARADFQNCYPLLKNGGYLVMDDSTWPTVSIVCDEITAEYGMKHILTERDSESGSSIFLKA